MKPWKPPHEPINGYYFALSQIWSQLRMDNPTSSSEGVWHYRNRLIERYGPNPYSDPTGPKHGDPNET